MQGTENELRCGGCGSLWGVKVDRRTVVIRERRRELRLVVEAWNVECFKCGKREGGVVGGASWK